MIDFTCLSTLGRTPCPSKKRLRITVLNINPPYIYLFSLLFRITKLIQTWQNIYKDEEDARTTVQVPTNDRSDHRSKVRIADAIQTE